MNEKIIKKAVFTPLQRIDNNQHSLRLDTLNDVKVNVDMKFGEATLPISEVRKFSPGYLIPLGKESSDVFIDILIDKKKMAKGEVVILNNEVYIRIVDINS